MEQPFKDPTVKRIIEFLLPRWALGHAMALMGWDLETYMPRRGVEDRSAAFEQLAAMSHRIVRSPELRKLVEEAEAKLESLNDHERGVVRVVSREVRIAWALPEELVKREAKVTSKATVVWEKAKKENNFELFKPYLEEIVEIAREKAERLGYEEHPYDALLDLYEEGLRTRDVEAMFNIIVPETKRILAKVLEDGYYPRSHPLEEVRYEKPAARRLLERILGLLEWPWDRGRVDESAHPFTIDMGVNDVRITVRYEGIDVKRVVYSLMHEYGHALYELQVDPRLARTPVAGGVSLGIHESQSRFWENIVGRSPWYIPVLKKMMDEELGFTRGYSVEDIYRYVNTVRPGLIRVDADEVTYNLHIYLRFTLEKKLVEGSMTVDELPEAWSQLMEELLGVRPETHSEGVLQDIHWSHGSIGYFPTYTIGNVVAAMIWRSLGGPEAEALRELKLRELREWLRDRIHRWGSVYAPRELLRRSLGANGPDAEALIEYLEWKYVRLPGRLPEILEAQ